MITIDTRINVKKYKILDGHKICYDDIWEKGNVALEEGIDAIWTLVAGGAETVYNSVNARTGVGDGTEADSATLTGLTGLNQLYKGMMNGYPTYGSLQTIIFKSEYLSGEAEWAWNEVTVDNGSLAAKNLIRRRVNLGTKPAGEIWELQIEIKGS